MTDLEPTEACAAALDAADPLAGFRDRFSIPKTRSGADAVYLCGNSLGLQPRAAREAVIAELDAWATRGVNGHFEGEHPWFSYHERAAESAAHVAGALPSEVVAMGSLTANLHAAMVSFYRPTPTRFRIVIEADAFPSDRYAVASQARLHGFDPAEAVLELRPRPGEAAIRDEDIESYLRASGGSVALVLLGAVNYLTGQCFDVPRLVAAARICGASVGLDLAHAIGNVPLQLHEDDVDFAVWCSYKYLNSGPGGVGGLFVHERHGARPELPRLAGWWGNEPATRFTMPRDFVPAAGAAGWQLSNAPVLPIAAFVASGSLFTEATMPALRAKSERMAAFLDTFLAPLEGRHVEVLTPREITRRGCQVSLRVMRGASSARELLEERGIVCDFRPPNTLRAAPVPLYNSFTDVYRFGRALWEVVGHG